jgi:hypothetical protein
MARPYSNREVCDNRLQSGNAPRSEALEMLTNVIRGEDAGFATSG